MVAPVFKLFLNTPLTLLQGLATVYMRGAQVYATPLAAVVAHILAVHRQRTWRP